MAHEKELTEMHLAVTTAAQSLQKISKEMLERLNKLAKELGIMLKSQYMENEAQLKNNVELGMNAAARFEPAANKRNPALENPALAIQINELNNNLINTNRKLYEINAAQTLFGNKPVNEKAENKAKLSQDVNALNNITNELNTNNALIKEISKQAMISPVKPAMSEDDLGNMIKAVNNQLAPYIKENDLIKGQQKDQQLKKTVEPSLTEQPKTTPKIG